MMADAAERVFVSEGFGLAPCRVEGEPIEWGFDPMLVPPPPRQKSWAVRTSEPVRRWLARQVFRLGDKIHSDPWEGW